MAVFPDQNIQGILRKHQASLLGWEPALSLRVPGTPWGGISCRARLGCPARGSLLWPPLQAGSVVSSLLPASCWEPHPLMEERCCKQTSAPQPPCILPVAAPRCQPALLTAGAPAGTAGFVLAEASACGGRRENMGWFIFLPSCVFCQPRSVLALFSCIKCSFL